jgi:hypothetical protein
MATVANPQTLARSRSVPQEGYPVGTQAFHMRATLAALWMVLGGFLDAWAHHNLPDLETFFTPWHGVLYSGSAVCALILAYGNYQGRVAGYRFWRALPKGYNLALLGVTGFFVGGVLDMLWHTILGIEVTTEAAISPPHLLLWTSGFLIVSGTLRAGLLGAFAAERTVRRADWAIIVLSITGVVLWLMTLSQIAHPMIYLWAQQSHYAASGLPIADYSHVLGIVNILSNTLFFMSVVMLATRRWQLPFGTWIAVFALYGICILHMRARYEFLPAFLATGLIADLLNVGLKPSAERLVQLFVFAFAVPFSHFVLYHLTIALTGSLIWSIHLWLGASVMSGMLGVLVAYLLSAQLPNAVTKNKVA